MGLINENKNEINANIVADVVNKEINKFIKNLSLELGYIGDFDSCKTQIQNMIEQEISQHQILKNARGTTIKMPNKITKYSKLIKEWMKCREKNEILNISYYSI